MRRFRRTPVVPIACPGGGLIEAHVATRPLARLAGLALLREPPARALLLPRCRSVHTVGMRFPIDVAFLDLPEGGRGARVVDVREQVPPGRVVAARMRDVAALELAAGEAARLGIRPGRLLVLFG